MSAGSTRRVEVDEVGDVSVARFVDKKILDETNIQIIGNQLVALVDEDARKKIVVDFSNVEYLSSAALSKLLILEKKAKAAGSTLRFCGLRPDIYQIFTLTKLNKLFDIYDSEEQALEGL